MLTGRTRAACIALLAPLSSSPPLPSHPSPSEAAAHGVGGMRGAVQLSAAAVAAHPLRAGAGHLRTPHLALQPALRPPRPAPCQTPLRPHRPSRLPTRPSQALHLCGCGLNRCRRLHRRIICRPRPHLRQPQGRRASEPSVSTSSAPHAAHRRGGPARCRGRTTWRGGATR